MPKNKPLVSIITIVYNGVNEIENTIISVLAQNYSNKEFIVIDGDSNDGTLNIIEKYKNKINYFISEKDKGIYDAMNKGILASKSKWLNFMNAGDTFFNEKVLSSVFDDGKSFENIALLYGYNYQNDKKIFPMPLKALQSGMIMANHQSMFFNSEILGDSLCYSLKYPIYGDYELVNRIYLKFGKSYFLYIDEPIAIYAGGGISSVVSFQKRKDKYLIVYNTYGLIQILKILMSLILKKLNINKCL